MYKKIINIKDSVKKVLEEYPDTRDNDKLLILKVWKIAYPNLKDWSFREFAIKFINNEFPDPESIRRSRQKIQEQHPELKFRYANERMERCEEMRVNIKTMRT
jgi:hypothetical protein